MAMQLSKSEIHTLEPSWLGFRWVVCAGTVMSGGRLHKGD